MTASSPLLERISSSRIAKSMLTCFIALAIIEGTLLTGLSYLVIVADAQASKKFAQLQAINDVSQLMQTSINLFYALHKHRPVKDSDSLAKVNPWIRQLKTQAEQLEPTFVSAKLDTTHIPELRSLCLRLGQCSQRVFENDLAKEKSLTPDEIYRLKQEGYDVGYRLIDLWSEAQKPVLKAMRTKQAPLIGASAFLNIAVGINILALGLLLYVVNRNLLAPLRRLTATCSQLRLDKSIKKPDSVENELGSLEQSFYRVSQTIRRNEHQKRVNAEMLSRVQTLSLQKLAACFTDLRSDFVQNARALKKIDSSLVAIARLQDSILSLVNTLRSTGGKQQAFSPKPSPIEQMLDAAVSMSEPLCEQAQISISIKIADELKHRSVVADEQLIVRVLVNLLSNAIKFSPPHEIIELVVEKAASGIRFAVRDQGPGIAQDEIANLFQAFQQTASAKTVQTSGTGLGLSGSKEIIDKHAGQFGCESEIGKGATFWFTLPDESATTPAATPTERLINGSPSMGTGKGLQATIIGMLIAFVIPQTVLLFTLDRKFEEVNRKAQAFELQQHRFLMMGDILFKYCEWRKDVTIYAIDESLSKLPAAAKKYLEVVELSKTAYRETSDDETLHKKLRSIIAKEREFNKTLMGFSKNIFSAHYESEIYGQAELKSTEVLSLMIDALSHLSANAASSYTLTNGLTSQILAITSSAAVFDSVMLIILAIIGLRTTDKILILKKKSDAFANGILPTRTLKGNDELSFLDKEFVDACTAIAEAQAQKQMLLAVINHDLRTPLTSIRITLQSFCEGVYGSLSPEKSPIATVSEQEVKTLLYRINRLLTAEKIDAGAWKLESSRVCVADTLDKVAADLIAIAQSKDLRMTMNCIDEPSVVADSALFELMLSELLLSAIDASAERSQISVTVSSAAVPVTSSQGEAESSDAICSISVRSEGEGLTDELLHSSSFEALKSPDEDIVDGDLTKADLVLAKKIAILHGGSLNASSSASLGTEILVHLPKRRPLAQLDRPRS